MVLLIAFAFIAGAATAVSPCVLPVLPVALSAGVTGGRRRPLGVVTGLALSFTFATVALVYLISALGLPDELLRTLSIMALIGFGITLMIPALGDRLEARLSRIGPRLGIGGATGTRSAGDGFWSGMLVGGGLGFLYAPCAGPILAGVITVSASQSFTAARLGVALAYGIGSAVVLYALMLGGRKVTGRLARRSGRFQMSMGAIMVLIALLMLGNYDTRFETSIASSLPSFLVDPTKGLETSHAAAVQLTALRGHQAHQAGGLKEADAGLKLPVLGAAPALRGTQAWFNTPGKAPLSLAGLRGHVVLVDFWTYSCINCLRTLPYLNGWYAKYASKGFTIIGVHTPEFPFEHSATNVAEAVRQNGIHYPVVQDNNYATWDAYNNEYWPAEYLIDAQGKIRLSDFGEGEYATKERAIRSLLVEAGASGLGTTTHTHAQAPSEAEITPETYLGAEKAQRFENGPIEKGPHDYGTSGPSPGPEDLRYLGRWQLTAPYAKALSHAGLQLNFNARRVFLVAGSTAGARPLRVLLDGRPIAPAAAGADVHGASATISFQRLYRIVELPRVERHLLTLEAAPGISEYSFTFG
ncbi:MAG TPA: cytochrome c biogenesis protein DipZ [Solirubrobacteraceae bacterium]|jgi:cytochrome c biogenesis protein CcdA/thiol-disulfide isomerase/thioredoxin|nr:cytochrome c biogenesis protein DipZ [Solirubrobacteraceae bacterium]